MVAQERLGTGTAGMLHVRIDVIWQGHMEKLTQCLPTLYSANAKELLVHLCQEG